MSVRDLAHFEMWLTDCGAEVLDPVSDREILRVRTNSGTHIVYSAKAGNQRWPAPLLAIVGEYNAGHKIPLAAERRSRTSSKTKQRFVTLTKRDGPGCFYCGLALPAPGTEFDPDYTATTEHLVARAHGGPNHLSNCFLSHRKCNETAGHLSAPEKIALREAMRGELK